MTYIAKYLPVEGEIKEGEHGLTSTGIVFKALKSHLHLAEGKQKVKLFLVSTDIKVGDKYLNDKFIEHTCTHELDSIITQNELFPFKYFKVIGEISPDALNFVKEGNVFTEDQIKFVAKGNADIYYKLTEKEFLNKYMGTGLSYYIEIKGSCGHFH